MELTPDFLDSSTGTPGFVGASGGGGRFEGTLPAELGELASLQELWLNIHSISGTVRNQPHFWVVLAVHVIAMGFVLKMMDLLYENYTDSCKLWPARRFEAPASRLQSAGSSSKTHDFC